MGKEALKTKEEMQAIARKNAAARIKKVGDAFVFGVYIYIYMYVHGVVHASPVERETARFLSVPVLMSHLCRYNISTRSVSGVLSWVLTPAPFSLYPPCNVVSSSFDVLHSVAVKFIHRPTTATYNTFLCR